MVQSEIKLMCNFQSVLKSKSSDDLKHFKWEMIFDELQKKAPVFLCFMMSATKTRNPRSNRIPVICMCTAILLKYRFKQLNLVQKVISLLLYSGNCSKEVSISKNAWVAVLFHVMKHMKHKERPAPMCTQWNGPMKHYETCGEPRSGTAAECAYDNSYTCCLHVVWL